jgi:hypothetical protein
MTRAIGVPQLISLARAENGDCGEAVGTSTQSLYPHLGLAAECMPARRQAESPSWIRREATEPEKAARCGRSAPECGKVATKAAAPPGWWTADCPTRSSATARPATEDPKDPRHRLTYVATESSDASLRRDGPRKQFSRPGPTLQNAKARPLLYGHDRTPIGWEKCCVAALKLVVQVNPFRAQSDGLQCLTAA